jgi:hypothetical protein
MISDHVIWHPVKYKLLWGEKSNLEYRAKIVVTKLPTTSITDEEIKSDIVDIINRYFSVENWDFGERVYFSELASYIHTLLANKIAGVALVPQNEEYKFGDLQEILCEQDEIPISDIKVTDIEILGGFNSKTIRIGK